MRHILIFCFLFMAAMTGSIHESSCISHSETLVITEMIPGLTTAKCENCYQKYIIKYNWPSDHKEPTIREFKETN